MIILTLIGILLALAIAFVVTAGLGPLAIVPFLLALIVGAWFLIEVVRGRSPGRDVRRVKKAELLGPGGPDDPDA
jgi:ABC-type thiamin/hydroxymethylpyrimidine transport system permease subunit